jgi:hypothetical protein
VLYADSFSLYSALSYTGGWRGNKTASAMLLLCYCYAMILIRVLGAAKCEGGSTPSTRLYAITLSNVVVLTKTLHLGDGRPTHWG